LILNADGSYTYSVDANSIEADAVDVFTYTIKDGDGDLTTATLTIDVNDVTVTASDTEALVNEAGLDTGSLADDSDIYNGAITPAGGTGPYTYTLTSSADGAYGSLVLNPDGSYTYTLDTAYDTTPDADDGTNTEQDRDSFTYQVEDANGNTTTGTIFVDIIDDVPQAFIEFDVEGDFNVEETGGIAIADFTLDGSYNAGADGFASDAYTLNLVAGDGVPSGISTIDGDPIYLFQTADNVIVGSIDPGFTDGDPTVFDITINVASGQVIMQSQGLDHSLADILYLDTDIDVVYTVTDNDGDTSEATTSLSSNVGFVDGVPTLGEFASLLLANEADVTASGTVDIFGNADGIADINISPILQPGWTSSSVDNIVDGVFVSTTTTILNDDGDTYGTLTIAADGTYSFQLITPTPIEFLSADLTGLTPGGPTEPVVLNIVGGDSTVQATFIAGTTSDTQLINSSTQGMGVDNNSLENSDESIAISFDENLTDIGFTASNLRNTGGSKVETLTWSVYLGAAIPENLVASGTYTPPLGTGESNDVSFLFSESNITFGSLDGTDVFDTVVVSAEDGTDYRLLSMSIETQDPPEDVTLDFNVSAVDNDGDVTDPQVLTVDVSGGAGPDYTLTGDATDNVLQGGTGNDILIGGDGNDILIGGQGNDTMTGGLLGSDTFEFSMAENTGTDTITDFEVGVDTLSFTDVIDDNSSGDIDLGDAISAVSDAGPGGNVTLTLTNGGSVTLEGIGTGAINDVDALQTLLGAANINVDPS
jgi:VCBS repeat-containing protein